MAHSHHLHREHQVSHRRVAHILKDEPSGSKQHAKSPAFSKVTSKSAAERHDDVAGTAAPKRFARGGKVKGHKGHQTNIAIVVPKGGDAPAPAGPMAAPGGPAMPPRPPMAPPPGGPPMAGPPGAPPPGMPMRKSGGRVIDGEATKSDLKKWGNRAEKNSYARGGAAKMTAGAMSGEGRLQKAGK